jgi:Fic family protein
MSYEPFPAFEDWRVDFDPTVVDAYADRLQKARAVSTPEARERALQIATRYAAVDTGAIEGLYTTDRGFTRTIATQSEFWERALEQRGERVARSIGDAIAGYDYVLDAVTGNVPISEKWIRELHAVITDHQESIPVTIKVGDEFHDEDRPLLHGQYKKLPNNPTNRSTGKTFYYASPEDTPIEMARLIGELNSEEFRAAHPVVQAAYAHYAYIRIHPFQDGNGRVARSLASVYLYRNPGVPLVIFADQRSEYLDSLEVADSGRYDPFERFITERVIDTVNTVAEALQDDDPEDDLAQEEIESAVGGWLSEGAILAANRLHDLCLSSLKEELGSRNLPPVLDARIDIGNRGAATLPDGYQLPGSNVWLTISALLKPGSSERFNVSFVVAATDEPDRAEYLVVPADTGQHIMEVWRREIDPVVTTVVNIRIETWARNAVRRFVRGLNGSLKQASSTS